MRQVGVDIAARTKEASAALSCDQLFFLRMTIERAAGITVTGLRGAAGGLGAAYESPIGFRLRFDARRNDGAAALRIVRWEALASAGCERPTWGTRAEPSTVDRQG